MFKHCDCLAWGRELVLVFSIRFFPPVVYSTNRSKAVVPVLVLLFVALWFILRGDLLYVLPCVILFLCFSVLLVLRLPRLGKRELILVLFVRLFDLDLPVSSSSWCLGVWEGLRFVIVAFPGLFSYLFRFALVCFCLFYLPPGIVSYLLWMQCICKMIQTTKYA